MITTLEVVRSLWTLGKDRVDAEKRALDLSDEMYLRKLEAVVESIKDHLRKNELLHPREVTVKHGEGTKVIWADLPNMRVRQDKEDPSRVIFEIPEFKEG